MISAKNLYIASLESHSGLLIVTMGMMEILKSQIDKIALFRPIIKGTPKDDHDINFLIDRYKLKQRPCECVGFTIDEVDEFLSQDKISLMVEELIKKYDDLSKKFDFILIQGLANDNFTKTLPYNINHLIAKNLQAPYISVINAKQKSFFELKNEIDVVQNSLKNEPIDHIGLFFNRLSEQNYQKLKGDSKKHNISTYFLRELEELNYISVDEIVVSLNCKVIYGKNLNRVVHRSKIAAMTPSNLLDRLEQNDLIIVSGDRLDVILTILLANNSKSYPTIAAIILTGSLTPPKSFLKLIDGIDGFDIPILTIDSDTYNTTKLIDTLLPSFKPNQDQKIALAMGEFMNAIDSKEILNKLQTHKSDITTPIMFEYSLFAKAKESKKRVVLPESDDERILRAADILLRRDVVEIVLLGIKDEILHKASSLGLDLSKAEFIDPQASPLKEKFAQEFFTLRSHKQLSFQKSIDAMMHSNYFATMLVYDGYVDTMVSGAIHTTQDTILPALQIIKTAPNLSLVSSLFFICLETKVLVYADCAINQNPTAMELAQIAIASADSASNFGIEPRVAMLSYSTGSSGHGSDVDKVREATNLVKQLRADILIEGPLQYDAAIDPDVAKLKLPDSKVAGRATVFIFPDLNTGNNTYKAVQRSANAIAIGPILQGLNRPINDLSRGCNVRDIVNTVLISAIQAGDKN